jgi:hypothetical protein
MPRVQTLVAIMLLASCCVGTSLMAHQRVPNLVFQEVAKANAERAAAKAAAVAAQSQAHAAVKPNVVASSLAGAK